MAFESLYREEEEEKKRGDIYRDPVAVDDVIDSGSLLRYGLEHAGDEVLGLLGDARPLGVGERVLAGLDAPLHARRDGLAVCAVEGRVAAA